MLRGFWNDPDGISMSDFLALAFTASYMGLLGMTVTKLLRGTVTAEDIQLLQVVTWPVMTILGGYFGGEMLGRLRNPDRTRPGPRNGLPYGGFDGDGGVPREVLDPRLPMPSPDPPGQAVETADEAQEGNTNGPG